LKQTVIDVQLTKKSSSYEIKCFITVATGPRHWKYPLPCVTPPLSYSVLTFSCHLRRNLKRMITSVLPAAIIYRILTSIMRATCLAYLISFDLIILNISISYVFLCGRIIFPACS